MRLMKGTIIALALLVPVATHASTPVRGQSVTYRYDSTHSYACTVAKANTDNTADLVCYAWAPYSWPFGPGSQAGYATMYVEGVSEGTSDNRWAVNPNVPLMADVDVAIDSATADLLVEPGAPASAGLTLGGSGVQMSTTRPVRLNVRLTASMTSTLLDAQSYTVELRCDSGSTPTTVVDDASGGLSGVVATTVQPAKLSALVPAGHYCRVVTASASANTTLNLTASTKQIL